MLDIYVMEEDLKKAVEKDRYEHSLRVRDLALELAGLYHVDQDKARIAGLMHDNSKGREGEIIEKYKDIIDFDFLKTFSYPSIHGPLGALVLREEYGIDDQDILNSIIYHTTGREAMSPLEKIVFIADKTAKGRSFLGLDEIRFSLKNGSLDRALLLFMDGNIKHLIDEGQIIDIRTLEARNALLKGDLE